MLYVIVKAKWSRKENIWGVGLIILKGRKKDFVASVLGLNIHIYLQASTV